MASKTLAKQFDPQYGWTVADPTQSQDFDIYQQAADLYKQTYGEDLGDYWLQILDPNSALMQRYGVQYTDPNQYYKNKQTVTDPLLQWYAAASNEDLMKNEVYRDYLKYLAQPLSADVSYHAARRMQGFRPNAPAPQAQNPLLSTAVRPSGLAALNQGASNNAFSNLVGRGAGTFTPALQKYEFGLSPEQYGSYLDGDVTSLQSLVDQYGLQAVVEANAALGQTGLIQKPHNLLAPLKKDIVTQLGKDVWKSVKGQTLANRAEGMMSAEDFYRRNPTAYGNAALMQYYDSPNATLISDEGDPWKAKAKTNLSRLLGGEDLSDDVFQYYLSAATPGQVEGGLTGVEGNPYLSTVNFNGQQAYFTPYDYAVHGVYDPTINRVNIANVDPNYWRNANLQRVGDQYGFVTTENPFANIQDPNKVLGLDKNKLVYKYDDSGGLFGGGFLGDVLGPLASVASFIPGPWQLPAKALSLANSASGLFSSGDMPNAPPAIGKTRPVFAPNYLGTPQQNPIYTESWIKAIEEANRKGQKQATKSGQQYTPIPTTPPPAPTIGGGLPSFQYTGAAPRTPMPGDADYAAYQQALATGRPWNYFS